MEEGERVRERGSMVGKGIKGKERRRISEDRCSQLRTKASMTCRAWKAWHQISSRLLIAFIKSSLFVPLSKVRVELHYLCEDVNIFRS